MFQLRRNTKNNVIECKPIISQWQIMLLSSLLGSFSQDFIEKNYIYFSF